ncbi:MAG: electron transfer flavoprotein subunit alpha/FixB family protein [Nitrososphaeria archaeon]
MLAFSDRNELMDELLTFLSERFEHVDAVHRSDYDPSKYRVERSFIYDEMIYDPWQISEALASLFRQGYDLAFFGASVLGREVAAIVSHLTGTHMESEIFDLGFSDGKTVITRYFFGGRTIIKKETSARVFTLMPGSVEVKKAWQSSPEKVKLDLSGIPRTRLIETVNKEKASVDITKAEILVAVGRGIARPEGLELAKQLASVLGAELAGSRPVCQDLHLLDEDRQVGLSGKKVHPKIYIAVGISGQIQHLVGMRDSKIVIAINKDKNAPIFNEADYGIVGDAFTVLPILIQKLKG